MRSLPQKASNERDFCSIGAVSWSAILDHSLDAYPQEACGILLCPGNRPGNITDVYAARNVTSEDPATTYVMEPLELLHVQKWAGQRQLEICGFYHSHPDHPAVPSESDRQYAWEGYLYLILSLRNGIFAQAGAWRWDPEEEFFQELTLLKHLHNPSAATILPLRSN